MNYQNRMNNMKKSVKKNKRIENNKNKKIIIIKRLSRKR